MKKKGSLLILGTVLIVLNGCMTSQDRINSYRVQCAQYDYAYGSSEMTRCVEKLDDQYRIDQRLSQERYHKERMAQLHTNAVKDIINSHSNSSNPNRPKM